MVALRSFRHSGPSFSDLVPYAALVENGVILLKDGSLMAGWYFAGPDSESSTDFERNEVSRRINAILARLGSGWMIQVEAVRVPTTAYPAREACRFPDPVSCAIDDERRARFERESGHFESRHAMILTWRSASPRKAGLARFVYADDESRTASFVDTTLDFFRTSIREIEQYLAGVLSIRRMVTREVTEASGFRVAHYDELFQFIRFTLTGENHPVRLPAIPMYLDWLAVAEFHHGLGPLVDHRRLAIVAIDGLPVESAPGILNALDLMPLTYRWSSRFMFLDEPRGARASGADAEEVAAEGSALPRSALPDGEPIARSGRGFDGRGDRGRHRRGRLGSRRLGYYTAVIVLFDEDEARLRDKAEAVRRLVQSEGFGARIETLNATEAFLGSLPGNWYSNVREPLISTRNLADLIPLNSVWSGAEIAPCPLSRGVTALDAGGVGLDAVPPQRPCRRRRPHPGVRTDRLGQVDAAGAHRRAVPSLRRRAGLRLRQGRLDVASDARRRRRPL